MDIYIIRHGRTPWNEKRLWQGNADIELDDIGLAQAERVGASLIGAGITAVYSSPLLRARVTAETISRRLGLEPILHEDLREVSIGLWEGLNLAQIQQRYPEQLLLWETKPEEDIGLGVENYYRLSRRATQAIMDITKVHGDDDIVAVVTHGAWIRAFLLYVMSIPMDKRLCFDLDNTGISIVRYKDDKFKVLTLNDHRHV